ncbi:methylated-DNA--[protein]-cysteine S-methyltransferase [Pelistega sp. MC2]|nr:methylated-DNA--[protein]-cysteine S-methyltransferase [Pelistega sp. MC2]
MMSNILYKQQFSTPIGDMITLATENGVCLLEFLGTRRLEEEQRDLMKIYQASIVQESNPWTTQVEQEVDAYFAGTLQEFTVPLVYPGTVFQQQVWEALRQLPFGQTSYYQALAEKVGKPSALRAVANANGQNRIAIIIPCHRVIGKNGSLTGYSGGLNRKQWLLEHERKYTNIDSSHAFELV